MLHIPIHDHQPCWLKLRYMLSYAARRCHSTQCAVTCHSMTSCVAVAAAYFGVCVYVTVTVYIYTYIYMYVLIYFLYIHIICILYSIYMYLYMYLCACLISIQNMILHRLRYALLVKADLCKSHNICCNDDAQLPYLIS